MSPIVIIFAIGAMLLIIVVPVAALYFNHKRSELWHQTARLALEKGQPLPGGLSDDPADILPPRVDLAEWTAARRAQSRSRSVKAGLVLIALGAGIQVFLYSVRARVGWVGAVPGFIGVALLLHSAFESLLDKSKAPSRLPQP